MDEVLKLLLEIEKHFKTKGKSGSLNIYDFDSRKKIKEKVEELGKQIQHQQILKTHAYYWVHEDVKLLLNTEQANRAIIDQYRESMTEARKHATPEELRAYAPQKLKQKPKKEPKPVKKIFEPVKKKRKKQKKPKTRNEAILQLIQNPNLNPFKTSELRQYFIGLMTIQKKQYLESNDDTHEIMIPQTEKDAYFAYQINMLILHAHSPNTWSGFENECKEITKELKNARLKGYNSSQLIQYFGPEMVILKIIKKKELSNELSTLVDKLLPDYS